MQHKLHIDLETRSAVDLRRTGVYPYAADPSTDVWVAAYAVDDEEVKIWIPGVETPPEIKQAVADGWLLYAHNAQFERVLWRECLTPRYGWPLPVIEQWRCTMVMAMAMALPASLENLVQALQLDIRKDMQGHNLMMRMAKPRIRRKGETTRADANGLLWWDDEERKQRLYAYCIADVEAERQAETRLLPLSGSEQKLWFLDQRTNDRGVGVDEELALAALEIVRDHTAILNAELKQLTGGAVYAGTNVAQLTEWLAAQGVPMATMDKAAVAEQLGRADLPANARRALEIRQSVGRASVKKINALLRGRDADGRARGLLQFHAASTGRWGGRRFQPHNIKRPTLKDVDRAIQLVSLGDHEAVNLVYGDPLSVVGDTLRGMVRAAPGSTLLASDFSNIEGRGLAWLAGEHWKLDAFREFDAGRGPDLYKLAYARSFGIPVEEITDAQRQGGKVQELALGYEGGVGALQVMAGAFGMVLDDTIAEDMKQKWRTAHPQTKALWRALIDAARDAVASPGTRVEVNGKLTFMKRGSFLFMRLPSGRVLTYPYPRLVDMVWVENKQTGKRTTMTLAAASQDPGVTFDADEKYTSVAYKGVDAYTRKWGDVFLYGGMLTENATQALSRDVLAEAMSRVESAGYTIVLTVHDEIVAEVPAAFGSFEEFNALMAINPTWADGFPIVAAGWRGERYRK